MAMLAFERGGVLRPDAELLGVGAGNEPTIYALTQRVKRVFATDLYAAGKWKESAANTMLFDPGRYWGGEWDPQRLVVQHMDGRELQYADASFDGIFSSSSIEHFGDFDDVARSLVEMHRVLRPGGVVSLSTEFRLGGPPPGMPGVLMFDRAQLESLLFGRGLSWQLLDGELDTSMSAATRATMQPFRDADRDVRQHVKRHGALYWDRLEWSGHPHIVLKEGEREWTSVHVALRKRG